MSETDDIRAELKREHEDLASEIADLKIAIERLNEQKFFNMNSTWPRFILTSLVRGLFVGLGTVLGATLLIYFVVQFLSHIDFIPIIGEWALQIAEIINGAPSSRF